MTTKDKKILAERWVKEYGDFLYRYTFSRINDSAIAEDLVQETFLAALKGLDRFEGKSSERTWLVSILKHKIIDFYRKRASSEKYFVESGPDSNDENFAQNGMWHMDKAPAAWDDEPENILEQKEFYKILKKCIDNLPEKISIVFTLRELEGLKSEDICKELDISPSNLWVMLHRARNQLRKCLHQNWFGTE